MLLAFEGAVEEGQRRSFVCFRIRFQITADLQLAEKIRTLQTRSRAATWVVCPAVRRAGLLCATNSAYREYFSKPFGLGLVLFGGGISVSASWPLAAWSPDRHHGKGVVDEVASWGR